MSNEIVQADYDQLAKIEKDLNQLKEMFGKEANQLQGLVDGVHKGWKGLGHTKFKNEWDNVIQPALMRMVGAIELNSEFIKNTIRRFQEAENEAADGVNPEKSQA